MAPKMKMSQMVRVHRKKGPFLKKGLVKPGKSHSMEILVMSPCSYLKSGSDDLMTLSFVKPSKMIKLLINESRDFFKFNSIGVPEKHK